MKYIKKTQEEILNDKPVKYTGRVLQDIQYIILTLDEILEHTHIALRDRK